jgi:hypothetical protein
VELNGLNDRSLLLYVDDINVFLLLQNRGDFMIYTGLIAI